ncbi:MAG: hypothetical protein R3C99_04440 [Pirellulaceae bacterium]|nr:hypothetical protein [Planctomycetales bacterium]
MLRTAANLWLATGLLLTVALASPGCATMGGGGFSLSSLLPGDEQPKPVDDGRRVMVVLKEGDAKPRAAELPFRDGMLVHDALVQSGAYREYNRMSIRLVRRNPTGGEQVLGIQYDHKRKRVPESSNYALWEGDRLMVEKEDSAVVTQMLDTVVGPLSRVAIQ